jgi:glutathione S-transferase
MSWQLPLPPAGLAQLEPVSPHIDDADARLEAAERLMRNHERVVRFAARAVGERGSPPVAAPLADPRAKPDELAVPAVDAALRHVVHALLEGPEVAYAAPRSTLPPQEVTKSLAYLRDRVGVPRDMSYAAARQLRGHLNSFSAELSGGKVMY